jgi:putative thiamine transport system permease protein
MGALDRGCVAQTLRRVSLTPRQIAGQLPLAALWAAPLMLAILGIIAAAFNPEAWHALFSHPQLWKGLALSLFIGTGSTIISTAIALYLAAALHRSKFWPYLNGFAGGMIAIPHFAFAVGFGFLIMPSGLLARLLAVPFGWTVPPHWVTTQDPLGLALIATLVFKEVPFLLWLMAAIMTRKDFAGSMAQLRQVSASLGHGSLSIWLRIFTPLILAQLLWPITIVWVYGASVVDMAIAIGPTQPPPVQLVVWSDLNSAVRAINERGTIGAVFFSLVLMAVWLAGWTLSQALRPMQRRMLTSGPSPKALWVRPATAILALFGFTYGAGVLIMLVLMSIGPHWPFPAIMPATVSGSAWEHAISGHVHLFNSLAFAVATTLTALALAILWFELLPHRSDGLLLFGALAALALPSVLLADGQYLVFLRLGLGGTYFGVYLAQLMAVFAYMFITLNGPYRAFDQRYRSVSLGLNASHLRFLWLVKLPLLLPVLAASAAIGIAVSIALYVPVQLVAAGRLSTWSIEAVTLASGGARHVLAAYALVMALIPALAFMAALRMARSKA